MMMNYEEEPMSPSARMFCRPRWNCYIIVIMGFNNTRFDLSAIKSHLELTLLKHPRFSSILVENPKSGKPRWIPTSVNIENHIILPNLDPKIPSPDQYVEDYISDIPKTPMDMSKPLWELHLLNVQTSYANSVGIFRIHHSIGDCASLTSLLLASTKKTGEQVGLDSGPIIKRANPCYSGGMLRSLSKDILTYLKKMWNTIISSLILLATVLFLKDSESPVKNVTMDEFNTMRFVHATVSMDDIKMVKKVMNMTINDVLMGVTEAGLTRYLNRRYGENGKDEKRNSGQINNISEKLRLRAAVIFNLRPTTQIQDLGDMMKKNSKVKWGNKVGYVLFPFAISSEDDPLDHLRRAKAKMDQKKLSFEARFSYFGLNVLVRVFGAQVAGYIYRRVARNTTMTISNVIGPNEELSFNGHPIQFLATTIYGHPHALTVHFQSYVNKMTITLSVDSFVIPNPRQLCDDLVNSLKIVTEAAIKKRALLVKDFV